MTPLEAALAYARMGWRVFPCHTVEGGACTCQRGAACPTAGKHPRTFSGVRDASADEERVRAWWTTWPWANVALACGRESGVWAIDIDPRHNGDASLDELELERGEALPATLSALSGGGGVHLLWRYPDVGKIGNRNNWLPGVDIKSDGGYIILPPSRHASGGSYVWRTGGAAAECPPDLYQMIGGGRSGRSGPDLPDTANALNGVAEGARNDTIFRMTCRWRREYNDDRAVIWPLVETMARNSLPPFPLEEARRTFESAFLQDHTDPPELAGVAVGEAAAEIEHFTDEGNARRFLRRHGAEVRYTPAWGWLRWDGCRWARDGSGAVEQLARGTIESIHAEANGLEDVNRRRVVQWALKSEGSARLDALLRLARVDPVVARSPDDFDTEKWLLNCRNGVLDLRTGELRAHDRSRDTFTRVTGVDVRVEATCPEWMSFLERVLPDPEVREFVRRAVGYSLIGEVDEEIMLILLGEGANGKTTFIETLNRVLGDYAMGTPVETILQQAPSGSASADLARLRGARFVFAQESEEGEALSRHVVKRLTGGDEIQARFLYRDTFHFHPEFTLWLSTNHFPLVRGDDAALWRRMKIIPFNVTIPVGERVRRSQLTDRFVAEGPGILAWALSGALAWREDGLMEPLAVVVLTDEQRKSMDVFGEWLEECCELGEDLVETSRRLYTAYQLWSQSRGERPWTMNAFSREMVKVSAKNGLSRVRVSASEKGWRGLKLRESTRVWGV